MVVGEDYQVKIVISQFQDMAEDSLYYKYGIAHCGKNDTPETIVARLVESLKKNFAREAEPVFEFTHTSSSLVITEVEPKWVLGTYPQRPVDFEVSVDTIVADGAEGPWGEVTIANSDNSYPNSKKIADFEWFCMGERGDQYRNYGWPNVIPTKYMVDPTNTDGYSVMNIHYSYVGSNESVQKSEKDIFLVGLESALSALKTEVEKLVK